MVCPLPKVIEEDSPTFYSFMIIRVCTVNVTDLVLMLMESLKTIDTVVFNCCQWNRNYVLKFV